MNSIPPILQTVITTHLSILLRWFSDEVYKRLLPRAGNHFLSQLEQQLDCAGLEGACAGYHHSEGPGAKPTHTVSRLVRALLVKYLFGWSLRQVEFQIRWNLLIKWYVGYAVFEAGPDHSTLERFEQWVCEEQHRSFFDDVLRQIDQQFPEQRQQEQIGDTFAMRANAASEKLIRLLRHVAECLLRSLAQVDTSGHERVIAALDQEKLFGPTDERSERRLDAEQRQVRLQTTVTALLDCMALVDECLQANADLTEADRETVSTWLSHLAKILLDEVQISHTAAGEISSVRELTSKNKGSYRIASATDPDATFRVHGEDKIDFGYNISVTATDDFIREIRADTGARPDAAAIPDLLTAQQEHHDCLPPKMIYDAAAGTGKYHALVEEATHGQTQLVAPLISYDKRTERFTPDDFTLSQDGRSLTCPQGETSTTAYNHGSGEGRTFRFSAAQCADCPLTQLCRGDQVAPERMRQVYISDHRSILAQARAYAQTDAYKLDLKRRSGIERIIANLTRYHGARDAQRRGLSKADFQAKMNATAFNLRQWLRLQERRSAASLAPSGP